MSGYGCFAKYYDRLTYDVDYSARAKYFAGIIKTFCPGASLVLDLACGTGSLTYALAGLGYDMIGADASEDMLAVATAKRKDGPPILFLRQKAEELDLFGTVDACVCALDSLNHLPGEQALCKAVGRVSMFLNPGGVFVFDMNTIFKHSDVLGNNSFVYDAGDFLCAWRNLYYPSGQKVEITLDFFERLRDGLYRRETESFEEFAYPTETVEGLLRQNGFELAAVYKGDDLRPPELETQRVVYVAVKRRGY